MYYKVHYNMKHNIRIYIQKSIIILTQQFKIYIIETKYVRSF